MIRVKGHHNDPVLSRVKPMRNCVLDRSENKVDRRSFLVLVAVSFLGLVAGFLPSIRELWSPKREEAPTLIVDSHFLTPWTARIVRQTAGSDILVLMLGNGELRAFENMCTHLACPVYFDPGSRLIRCPCHEGVFDPYTGAVVSGPPRRPLERLDVKLKDSQAVIRDRLCRAGSNTGR